MTNQGGGSGAPPLEWTQVWNSATVATLASGAFLSFPFDQYVPGVPQRDWLSFTTTNGSLVLDPGTYLIHATFSYHEEGSGAVYVLVFALDGSLQSTFAFLGGGVPDGRNVTCPVSGFIDTGQTLDFQFHNVTGAAITGIDGYCNIIKLT